MKRIHKQVDTPYTQEQLYPLIAQTEQYPQFLPWCQASQVHHRQPQNDGSEKIQASLHIQVGPIRQSFTTANRLTPYESVTMQLLQGPFKTLNGQWKLVPLESGTCIDFTLDFEFANKLLAMTLSKTFDQVVETLVSAFVDEAQRRYGHNPSK